MASIYPHRGGYQAAVMVNGERRKRNFATHHAARRWAAEVENQMHQAAEPLLGGANKATVAAALDRYARLYSVAKKSAKAEIDRINRYLVAAGMPRLVAIPNTDGPGAVVREDPKAALLPKGFEHVQYRRGANRVETARLRAELAVKPCSRVSRSDLRAFIAAMQSEGLSGATIGLEMSLLKHLFNVAIDEWSWVDFANPVVGLRMPKRNPARRVKLSRADHARLIAALNDCDNPQLLFYVLIKLETSARRGSLLKLLWSDLDLDNRSMRLYDTKTGLTQDVPLTRYAVHLFQTLPREADEPRVFPISPNALTLAWRRVREKAGRPDLREHDLRHIALTWLARRLGSASKLQHLSGHTSIKTLEIYIDMTHEDVLESLDATEPDRSPPPLVPVAERVDLDNQRAHRKARRLTGGLRGAGPEAPPARPASAKVLQLDELRAQRAERMGDDAPRDDPGRKRVPSGGR